MSSVLKLRRGTTAQHASFTGAAYEVTIDTSKWTLIVHDGVTAGGVPLLKEAAIGVGVQAYDADLSAIAALSGTSGLLKKTALNTWTLDTATYLVSADIGSSVQGYDANTVKKNVENTFTDAQRGSVTTDNDLSFDMSVGNNFLCTPTGTGTLTFTNITAGQSGYVTLVNASGYAISKAASIKAGSSFLATISAAGSYMISYHSPDGTNVYVTSSGALS